MFRLPFVWISSPGICLRQVNDCLLYYAFPVDINFYHYRPTAVYRGHRVGTGLRDPQSCLSGASLHSYVRVRRSTLSSSSYSRQGSLSDDSGISLSSGRNAGGRERSESRESSIGGYSRVRDSGKTTSTTTLGRRFGTSTCTLSGISVTEMFNKYSPSNYTRCSTDSTADSVCSRSHSATTTSSRRSVGVGGAVGGCSTPSIEQRRSRLSSTEVILQFNNNNQVSSEEDDDDNGNEAQLSVAEIHRRRFDGSSPSAATPQNDGAVRRHSVKSSPSPVLSRKVYCSSKAEARKSSSEDEEEEGEEARDDDVISRRSPAGGVAGGATTSPSSATPPPESPKPSKLGHQSADAVSGVFCVSLPICGPRAQLARFSCGYLVKSRFDSRRSVRGNVQVSLLPASESVSK